MEKGFKRMPIEACKVEQATGRTADLFGAATEPWEFVESILSGKLSQRSRFIGWNIRFGGWALGGGPPPARDECREIAVG